MGLYKLLHLLNRFNSCFQKHGLDPQLISRIFREALYFICAGSLNNILLRKDMCHWSKGMQIRYNVAQVEQWARDIKIDDKERDLKATDTLEPIVQAATLLQVRILSYEFLLRRIQTNFLHIYYRPTKLKIMFQILVIIVKLSKCLKSSSFLTLTLHWMKWRNE